MTDRASPPALLGEVTTLRLLPHAPPPLAPVAGRVMGRVGVVYAAIWCCGLALTIAGPPALSTAGAGLLVPGGGHAVHGHLGHTAVALGGFALSLLAWWMVGAAVLPLLAWIAAVLSASLSHHHHDADPAWMAVTASAVPASVALALLVHQVRHRRQVATARRLNEELATTEVFRTAVPSASELPVGEASATDLSHLRFALDLALQPLDMFDGFDRRDQFREAALRYQLCILEYALSTFRFTHAPAWSGALAEAQARAILKIGDRRVWDYWPLENAWGRFSTGRDPVENRDNVMLTGWQGVAVGMFTSLEDDRFARPGSLTYRWSDDETYAHDFGSLAGSIHRNMHRSRFTLFSCEPRWIYPVCNTFGANTLLLHDRLIGTTLFAELEEPLRRSFEQEFQRPDGRMIGVRNETLGLSWNIWASDGVHLPTTFWLHSSLPDLAERAWWMTRHRTLVRAGDRFVLPRTAANRCDVGSYTVGSDSFAQTFLSLTARELGDDEVADLAFAHVNHQEPVEHVGGVARYPGLSTQGNLYSLIARFGRHSGTRDLIGAGIPDSWRTGPRLADASYPDVLVARAVSDGVDLDLVLYPGEGPTRATLVIDRLVPDRTYALVGTPVRDGETVRADTDGRAVLHVHVDGRTPLRVVPTW